MYGTSPAEAHAAQLEVRTTVGTAEAVPADYDFSYVRDDVEAPSSKWGTFGLTLAAVGSVGALLMLANGASVQPSAAGGTTTLAASEYIPVPQTPAISSSRSGSFAVAADSETEKVELQMTPFGPYPTDCVHVLREDGKLRHTDSGVDVLHIETGELLESYPKMDKCTPYQKQVLTSRQKKREGVKGVKSEATESFEATPTTYTPGGGTLDGQSPVQQAAGASIDEPSSELDGWVDYVGFWPKQDVTGFNATYTVPAYPKSTSTDQVLFYFIGIENIEESESNPETATVAPDESLESTITILQPVLTYGNTEEGWSMASWNCCPTGQTWMSSSITNLKPNNTLTAEISVGSEYSTITSSLIDPKHGTVKESYSLTVDTEDRSFDWMDVTLEVYQLTECEEFADSAMHITDMVATGSNGKEIKMDWVDNSGATDCNGYQKFDDSSWMSKHSGTGPISR